MSAALKRLNPIDWPEDLSPVERRDEIDYPLAETEPPAIRERLHTLCALYGHARTPDIRGEILGLVEALVLETAQSMAIDLLAAGWKATTTEAATEARPYTGKVLYLDI